ncbi:unnamed protein product [Chondrus crispus]|uniref:Uncharacterized protein n=1 Tax=Chondrus crispus TaxID=2769 RepID=R7QFZ4_CHOCR|nr:unnamed protein product [Chondrus crispus]CDF36974.1 unnamed protein product [Chondrus crispus]|eukprot:XP_005716793.1 unnamed protein product [Chondrus crispus]
MSCPPRTSSFSSAASLCPSSTSRTGSTSSTSSTTPCPPAPGPGSTATPPRFFRSRCARPRLPSTSTPSWPSPPGWPSSSPTRAPSPRAPSCLWLPSSRMTTPSSSPARAARPAVCRSCPARSTVLCATAASFASITTAGGSALASAFIICVTFCSFWVCMPSCLCTALFCAWKSSQSSASRWRSLRRLMSAQSCLFSSWPFVWWRGFSSTICPSLFGTRPRMKLPSGMACTVPRVSFSAEAV